MEGYIYPSPGQKKGRRSYGKKAGRIPDSVQGVRYT
jgi:hypothetical protein